MPFNFQLPIPNVQHTDRRRQPHRKELRAADPGRHRPRHGSAADQDRARRLRAHDVRPRVHEHRQLPQRHHLHRRRQGHPALSRVSDRAAGRRERLPRDGVPDPVRRAADRGAAAGLGPRDHPPHDAPREHQEAHGGVPVRRAPDGDLPQHGRRALDVLSRRQADLRQGVAAEADAPADCEGAEHRRLRVPPQHRTPVHLSRQRAELHRQLPEHAVQDDRAEVPPQSGAGAGARRAVHPARRSRAELQHDGDAGHRQLAGRSVFGARRRGGRALRPAARRRQRSRAAHARRDRLGLARARSSSSASSRATATA